jgi:hypothetical protein
MSIDASRKSTLCAIVLLCLSQTAITQQPFQTVSTAENDQRCSGDGILRMRLCK